MPIPYSPPTSVPEPGSHPVPDPQDYAIGQERARHDGALYRYGEYAVFVLMWTPIDFSKGLVDRCSLCFGGKVAQSIAEVYGQAAQANCPVCFGTSFEGGWKAKLVRPSTWDDAEEQDLATRRGFVHPNTAAVQSTSDFRIRSSDFIFRSDGTRWQVRSTAGTNLVTGFGAATRERTITGYNMGQVALEDESSVAYLIEPTTEELRVLLDAPEQHSPTDFSDWEQIRGPIL